MLKRKDTAWSPGTVWQHLSRGDPLYILDLRSTEEFGNWRVEGPHPVPTENVPYWELLDLDEAEDVTTAAVAGIRQQLMERLPHDRTVLAVCPEGHTSGYVAEALRQLDFDAVNLDGGMEAWGKFYYWRPVVEEERFALYQVVRPARGCISHMVVSDHRAAVIDPARHVDVYHDLAAAKGAHITRVLDTHLHADHLSGGPLLSERFRVPYHLHPYDAIHPMDMVPARLHFRYLQGEQTFFVGRAEVRVVHLPGHTLGMVAFLVEDRYLLTGDSLFLESIARPDLGGKADTWTPLLYHSLVGLMELPDETVVLPAHFSDITAADNEGRYQAPLGRLKRDNPGLAELAKGEEAFGAYVLESLPEFPEAYVEIKRANAGLAAPDEARAQELELGKNICALGK